MTNAPGEATPVSGVQFAEADGRRSSQSAAKAILSAAVANVDAALAQRIAATKDWRKDYVGPMRDVVAAGVRDHEAARRIAADGLDAVRRRLVFVHKDEELDLQDAFRVVTQPPLHTVTIAGRGEAQTTLSIPYRGRRLEGDDLLRQLDVWREARVLEPSAAEAISLVVRHPDWLDLSDVNVALLGAASQMGPLEMLSAWRANVMALDLPRPYVWETVVKLVRRGAGRAYIACSEPANESDIGSTAGVDLMTEGPRVRDWLLGFSVPLVVGNYVYADGAGFVRLAAAVDALVAELLSATDNTSLAYLATPTDAFAVPRDVVDDARSRKKGQFSVMRRVLRPATASRLFAPNYSQLLTASDGRAWGIADCLVPIQGPNYALAKSLQRWRATTARAEGTLSSANVAPSTRTTSVVKNRMLAAAYRGAGAFGIEIFEPETSRAVMAALLVHDLRNPRAPARPTAALEHPFELFAHAAVHGGLWRTPFEPRSVLPLALLLGLGKKH